MFDRTFVDSSRHSHTTVHAAPPGEAIRYADDIRKELEARSKQMFDSRINAELQTKNLGNIGFTVVDSFWDVRSSYCYQVYYRLNGELHQFTFDTLKVRSSPDPMAMNLVQSFLEHLGQHIARELVSAFMAVPSEGQEKFGTLLRQLR